MQAAVDLFRANLARARNLGAIYAWLAIQPKSVLDFTDILRAELVMAVSAFDQFIHEVVREGVVEIFKGNRPQTDAYRRFQVSLGSVHAAFTDTTSTVWLDEAICSTHAWLSFQHADKVADAMRLILPVPLWVQVANKLGEDPGNVKSQLNLIVDRRNKIAHEADMDPTSPGARWPITPLLVKDSLDFLENLGETIFSLL